MPDKPVALDAYEALAEAYAAAVETKPHNAYYERPATLALLSDVDGKRVLDAGCGPGIYAALLVERGARVVALNASPKMVDLARRRLGSRAEVREADLSQPLEFLGDAAFDLVLSPLALDYVEDWAGVFREFYRVLRRGGRLVFSVNHPFADYLRLKPKDYFRTELTRCEWKGFAGCRVLMPSFRRPLSAVTEPLSDAGFLIERLVEPRPTEEFRRADPRHHEELMREPGFLCVRARKPEAA